MNVIELAKSAGRELWNNSGLYLFVGAVLLGLVAFVFLVRGQVEEGRTAALARAVANSQRETWCYEEGYFEVVRLEKLQRGYVCVDAREPDLIRTLIIPKEISE